MEDPALPSVPAENFNPFSRTESQVVGGAGTSFSNTASSSKSVERKEKNNSVTMDSSEGDHDDEDGFELVMNKKRKKSQPKKFEKSLRSNLKPSRKALPRALRPKINLAKDKLLNLTIVQNGEVVKVPIDQRSTQEINKILNPVGDWEDVSLTEPPDENADEN